MEDEPRKITQVSGMRTEGKDKIILDLNLDDDQLGQGKIPMETLDSTDMGHNGICTLPLVMSINHYVMDNGNLITFSRK